MCHLVTVANLREIHCIMNKIFTFENFQVFYSAHRNNFSLFGCANIVARGGNLGIVCFLLSSPPLLALAPTFVQPKRENTSYAQKNNYGNASYTDDTNV